MTRARIVVVEDEMIVGKDIQTTLQSFGYEVPEVVASGEAAIQAAFRLSPDLMLMDIMIKGAMDGVDAAEVIRSQFNIPVVYLTAYSDDETLRRAKLTESYGFVAKPFDERELYVAVEFALYRHQLNDKRMEKIQWYSSVIRHLPEPMVILDAEGKVEALSASAEEVIQAKEYEIKGQCAEISETPRGDLPTPSAGSSVILSVRSQKMAFPLEDQIKIKNDKGIEKGRILRLAAIR